MKNLTKRILIANDVLMQLASGALIPRKGVLIGQNTKRKIRRKIQDPESGAELQAAIQQQTKCEACANGCLLIAHIQRFDGVSLNKFEDTSYDNVQRITPLAKIFGKTLMDEIEAIFEGERFYWHRQFTAAEIEAMKNWRNKVLSVNYAFATTETMNHSRRLSVEQRVRLLTAIMQTLIENDGEKVIL